MAKKDWMIKESELDEDQIRVLMATNKKSLVVSGCAGSGKSVLALIKAQRIQEEEGDDYQIIVFTKALCRYMNAGRSELGLKKDFSYHYKWKKRDNCPKSDYIIVDEIQDFEENEINDFFQATKKNFFFFGDTAQSIYEGLKRTVTVEHLKKIDGVKSFELFKNYRLPRPVAKIVQYVGVDLDGFDINTYKSQENAIPRIINSNNLESSLIRIIRRNSNTDIGILLPTNRDVKFFSDLLNQNSIIHEAKYEVYENMSTGELEYAKTLDNKWVRTIETLNFNNENPKIMTYHSAKGLQFTTVILPKVEDCSSNDRRKSLYVAMTRTCRNLYILHSGFLPYPLSEIPANLYETTESDQVEDI